MAPAGGMDWQAKRLEGKVFTVRFIDSAGQIHLEDLFLFAAVRLSSSPHESGSQYLGTLFCAFLSRRCYAKSLETSRIMSIFTPKTQMIQI